MPEEQKGEQKGDGDSWDPSQYDRFREERQQPFYDLLKLVLARKTMRIVDLGCGTGELTREMHRHFKAASTLGIDSSESMLARAAEVNEPGVTFARGNLEDVAGEFDLVLSNAALHWVDDHASVLAKLTQSVATGGQLAIQMPANQDHPSHVVASALAQEMTGEGVRQYVLPVERYAVVLHALGYRKQSVHMQVYAHRLPTRIGVVEWVKGAMLTDLRKRMTESDYAKFLDEYIARLLPQLEDTKPYLYTFKRIFLWAERT